MHRQTRNAIAVLAAGAAACLPVGQSGAETSVEAAARTGLAIAVYQQGMAVVRDTRRVTLAPGGNRLAIGGVSPALQPETVMVALPPSARARLLVQDFDDDLPTPEALLERSEGTRVDVLTADPQTGEERTKPGTVLSAHGRQALVEVDGRVRLLDLERLAFPAMPAGFRAEPALVLALDAESGAEGPLTVTYLTGGVGWQADYVAMLGEAEGSVALTATVTIANGTDASFTDARVRLVAGDVAREAAMAPKAMLARMETSMAADAAGPPQPVADLHVYTLERPVTLRPQQRRRVSLFAAAEVAVEKEYRLEGGGHVYQSVQRGEETLRPQVRYRLLNEAGAGLGQPLPAGVVRVYREDEGLPILVGEDRIGHLPVGEEAWLATGKAFDVTAKRRQTEFRREGLPRGVHEAAFEIVLRNARQQPVTVAVVENIPGDWEILRQSQPHARESAGRAVWQVDVPAGGEATLTYGARVRF